MQCDTGTLPPGSRGQQQQQQQLQTFAPAAITTDAERKGCQSGSSSLTAETCDAGTVPSGSRGPQQQQKQQHRKPVTAATDAEKEQVCVSERQLKEALNAARARAASAIGSPSVPDVR